VLCRQFYNLCLFNYVFGFLYKVVFITAVYGAYLVYDVLLFLFICLPVNNSVVMNCLSLRAYAESTNVCCQRVILMLQQLLLFHDVV